MDSLAAWTALTQMRAGGETAFRRSARCEGTIGAAECDLMTIMEGRCS